MDLELHFDEGRWSKVEKDWSAWWTGETDRSMVMLQTLDTLVNADPSEFTMDFLLHKPAAEVIQYYGTRLGTVEFYGDAFPKWLPYAAPGIVSGFLGGPVKPSTEHRTTWLQVEKPVPYDELHLNYDPDNIWWRRILELTGTAADTWGDKVALGYTDMGGPMDNLASFRTADRLLYDLYDYPEEVTRCTGDLTQAWLRYHDEISRIVMRTGRGTLCWTPLLSPGRMYMLQCDFSAMISPRMFEKFILHDLTVLCDHLDYTFYHLDGPDAVRHLDILLSIKSLRGIQWIPGSGNPGPSQWLPLLKKIKEGGKLCQVYVNAKGALSIARELGCSGFAFYILPEEPYTDAELNEYFDLLANPGDFLNAMLSESKGKR
jgi:hypothetical protein